MFTIPENFERDQVLTFRMATTTWDLVDKLTSDALDIADRYTNIRRELEILEKERSIISIKHHFQPN